MNKNFLLISILIFLSGEPAPAVTTTPSRLSAELLEAIRTPLIEGRYGDSERAARAALASLGSADDPLLEAELRERLVYALHGQGRLREPEARQLIEKTIRLREAALSSDDPENAYGHEILAQILLELDDNAGALAELERVRAVREVALGVDHFETARARVDITGVLQSLRRYEEADSLLDGLITTCESNRRPTDSDSLRMPGTSEVKQRTLVLARAYNLRSNGCNVRGDFVCQEEFARKSANVYEEVFGPDHPVVATALIPLGIALRRQERLAEARATFDRALAISERTLGPLHETTQRLNYGIAGTLWAAGAKSEALPYAQKALAINEQTLPEGSKSLLRTYRGVAMILEDLGQYAEARELYVKALTGLEHTLGTDDPEVAQMYYFIAKVSSEMGKYEDALAASDRALAIGASLPEWEAHLDRASVLMGHGKLLQKAGRCTEAVPFAESALALALSSAGEHHIVISMMKRDLSVLLATAGETDRALSLSLEAADMSRNYLRIVARSLSEREALLYASKRAKPRGHLLSLLAARAEGEAPEMVESIWDVVIRSRTLVLDEIAARVRPETPDTISAIGRAMRAREDAARLLASLLVLGNDTGAEAGAIGEARTALDAAERDLLRSGGAPAEGTEQDVGFGEVSAALPEGSALLAFVLYERRNFECGDAEKFTDAYGAFVLRGAGSTPHFIDLGAASEIDDAVSRWRMALSSPESHFDGADLATAIWTPVEPYIGDASRVFLVPEGSLHLVNLAALPVDSIGWLLETGPTFALLSAERDLVPVASEEWRNSGLLALGDPDFEADPSTVSGSADRSMTLQDASTLARLSFRGERSPCVAFRNARWNRLPGSAREIEETASLWKSRSKQSTITLTGGNATESAFKSLAPGKSVIHIATHGFFLSDDCGRIEEGETRGLGGYSFEPEGDGFVDPTSSRPFQVSGLVLAGANRRDQAGASGEDGILTAEEIAALDLRGVEGVVLSGCETGVGRASAGEGVLGLRRAFRAAGARSLVMSLWAVEDDSARTWMHSYYTHRYSEGQDAATAARNAALDLLRDKRLAGESDAPFAWASFVAEAAPK